MKDTFLSARLVTPDTIRLMIFSSAPAERFHIFLIQDDVKVSKLQPSRQNSMSGIFLADFHFPQEVELGHSYRISIDSYGETPLDVSEATSFPGFDEKYRYDGELGARVHDERTDFALWAPLASKVSLKLKRPKEDSYSLYPMKRGKNGEYTISFPENLDGSYYLYQIVNSEVLRETTDPYAKGSTLNSKESVVIDFKKLKQSFHREDLPTLTSPTDAIIYEGHVRDLTIDSHT
ncbi:MAG: hypothetical protein J6038_03405, partial [Bacilli bacterium]|nr:hypothetical protein [Bacilli bacterium]